MEMNLGQIISRATEMAGANLSFSSSDVSFWANQAYREVATRTKYRPKEALAVFSTTSGERELAVPADLEFVTSMTLTMPSGSTASSAVSSIVPLRQREAHWMDSQHDKLFSGIPEVYASYATWLELYPSPNSAYSMTMRYQAKLAVLTDSTSTPALDERWHPAIMYKTVELLHAARLDPANEMMARGRYLSYMESTPSDDAWRQADKRGMGVRFARSW